MMDILALVQLKLFLLMVLEFIRLLEMFGSGVMIIGVRFFTEMALTEIPLGQQAVIAMLCVADHSYVIRLTVTDIVSLLVHQILQIALQLIWVFAVCEMFNELSVTFVTIFYRHETRNAGSSTLPQTIAFC